MLLPVNEIRPQLIAALSTPAPRIILKAPTGSGKSTAVPAWILDSLPGTILVAEPRRMAARMLGEHVSRLRSLQPGQEIGFITRFESRVSRATRLLYVTDGILERMLVDNPTLEGVSAVVFDEFHERRLAGDISLGRVLQLQESSRPDLAVIVMSATLETGTLADFLGPSHSTLVAGGSLFPVEIIHCPPSPPQRDRHGRMAPVELPEEISRLCHLALRDVSPDVAGSFLVFLPGAHEIRRTQDLLASDSRLTSRFDILPLHASLPPDQQWRAIQPSPRPRIILATNVAETSLTIEGIRTVIDSGLARTAQFDPARGLDTLHITKISQAAAAQRAGRAGRLAPGRCFRLWTQADHARRAEFEAPEILRVDLSGAMLSVLGFGFPSLPDFPWLDAPTPESVNRASDLLVSLGAITPISQSPNSSAFQLTPLGSSMRDFPLSPRLSRLMLAGVKYHCLPEITLAAALLEGEPLWVKPGEIPQAFSHPDDISDFAPAWRAMLTARHANFDPRACQQAGVSGRAARQAFKAIEQLQNLAARLPGSPRQLPAPDFDRNADNFRRALLESFSDHVVAKNGSATLACRAVGGKRGKLSDGVARHGDLLVSTDITEIGRAQAGKPVETRFSSNTLISRDLLRETFPDWYVSGKTSAWNDIKRRVTGRLVERFRDLTISDEERGEADPAEASRILAELVANGTLQLTRWDDSIQQWIIRLNSLREWMPELDLPGFGEEDRQLAFTALCEGSFGYKDIKDREILPVLQDWLNPQQLAWLDEFAPTRIDLPNGNSAKVRYDELGQPRIALTLQRLIGVNQSPLVAAGRVTVITEVLAPSQRPWQVTRDLASFWTNSYPQMKKDLAGRYPRHNWP